ncbi:uncharacterized protein LOC135824278 [Sycon ciliatum]|uniref:uncharacterized protein LOC135824278 n=1 Tax=Sycon ciliatum TaxID=27933 RepID=UPI0031F70B1F
MERRIAEQAHSLHFLLEQRLPCVAVLGYRRTRVCGTVFEEKSFAVASRLSSLYFTCCGQPYGVTLCKLCFIAMEMIKFALGAILLLTMTSGSASAPQPALKLTADRVLAPQPSALEVAGDRSVGGAQDLPGWLLRALSPAFTA